MNIFSIVFEICKKFLNSPQSNRNKVRKSGHFDEKKQRNSKENPAVPRVIYLLRNIFHNFFGRIIQDFGVTDKMIHIADRHRIGVAVGDTLITGDAVIHKFAFFNTSVGLVYVFVITSAKGEKQGNVAKFVQMVINGRDAQGGKAGDNQCAVEGGYLTVDKGAQISGLDVSNGGAIINGGTVSELQHSGLDGGTD